MYYLASIIGKISKFLLKLVHRGGSLPGEIVLKIDKTYLRHLKYPKDIILVTGTNGKSTVTNMIYRVLSADGKNVVCNLAGNNLKMGAVSLLLDHSTLSGKVKGDVLLLEVDELSVPRIMEDIEPKYIVINNFFRDQLDRAGEMENIVRKIEACVKDYKGTLVLNGNDPSVARIALSAKKADVHYYGFDKYEGSVEKTSEASEGRFCPICAKPITYDYYQYSHIGKFHCEDHFGNYELEYTGKIDSICEGTYSVNGEIYHSPYRAVYAFYNELAVISLCKLFGVSYEVIHNSIMDFQMNNGRMEHYKLKNHRECILNLAKNPTGMNESLKYVVQRNTQCIVGLVLNDLEADGHDVSWIYDARMELLCNPNVTEIVTCGTRYLDMALRMEYTGYKGKITPIATLDEFVSYFNAQDSDVFVVANYTSLQPVRAALKRGSVCVR